VQITTSFAPAGYHYVIRKTMKKAIVIGASSGIGRELAKILSGNGFTVGVMARRAHLLNELRNEIKGEVLVQEIDAADTETAMGILASFIEKMGGTDLVVISAGTGEINDDLKWPLEHETIRTNVTGFAAIANVAIHHFIKKGSGHLVCISSIAALRGGRESNYIEGLRQKIRRLKLPITVTDIKPGFVKTAMAKGEGIFWAAPADKAAMQIYDAIKRKKDHAYITRRWRLIAWLLKGIPARIYERL
jgi:short-subunit dehydrogenase